MWKCKYWRKLFVLSTIYTVFSLPVFANEKGGLRSDDIVAVCGDSITEQKLYSAFIEMYLT
ncbi:MAG: hypothetical protein WCS96_13390, partial [Victivallales bacterium]